MDSEEALEMYLDFLDDSSPTEATPRIDAVLQQYKRKGDDKLGLLEQSEWMKPKDGTVYESRLLKLEKQLTDLLAKSSQSKTSHTGIEDAPAVSTATRDVTSYSDSEQTTPSGKTPPRPSHSGAKERSVARNRMSKNRGVAKMGGVSSIREDRRKRNELLQHGSARKESQEESAKLLMLELDGERERRLKAEQAASRLVTHVKNLQGRLSEADKKHEATVVRAAQVQGRLEEEQRAGLLLARERDEVQVKMKKLEEEQREVTGKYRSQVEMFRELERNYEQLEQRRMAETTELRSTASKSEASAAGHLRELELLRRSLADSEGQVKQLQQLLIKKEEQRHEVAGEKLARARDQREDMAARLHQEQVKMAAAQDQLQARLVEKQEAYDKLEEEFRLALRLEAGRYNELERAHQEVCEEVDAIRQTAVCAVQKEQKAVGVVGELTGLVKDLQLKVKDLSGKTRQLEAELKGRKDELEECQLERNKLEVELKAAKEELGKLEARLLAQTSLVEGLKEERKVWGQELAHQGSSMAQERGRLQSLADSLDKENRSLRVELQQQRDAVRIKEKQLEDHAHSLQQLRREAVEGEREREAARREVEEMRRRAELEQENTEQMQGELLSLAERKVELKEELAAILEDRDNWKNKFRDLQGQWEEKVASIGVLEQNLQQLHDSFTARESKLATERDQAASRAKSMEERVRACDDAFREQLEAKEAAHQAHFSRLEAQMQKDVDLAETKVKAVEEEMRVLLEEVAMEKTKMEAKVVRLTTVLRDFQQDIVDQDKS